MSPRRGVDGRRRVASSVRSTLGCYLGSVRHQRFTSAGGPHLRALTRILVLIGMFLLGCGVLLVNGVLKCK